MSEPTEAVNRYLSPRNVPSEISIGPAVLIRRDGFDLQQTCAEGHQQQLRRASVGRNGGHAMIRTGRCDVVLAEAPEQRCMLIAQIIRTWSLA
jgi:hypothetical protein